MSGAAITLGRGRYLPIARLASGGSADLFLAEVEGEPARRVVVKRPKHASHAGWFERECRLGQTLHHPGLVRVVDVGVTPEGPVLVLEQLEGADLRSLLQRMAAAGTRAFPIEGTVALGSGIAAVLAYLHREDVVHGDVAPSNLFIGSAGDVRLLDLGFARIVPAEREKNEREKNEREKNEREKNESMDDELDAPGGTHAAGSVPYMSPEQAAGQPLDPRSDVFSLGIVLFELATGKRLFRGQTDHETLRMIQDRDVPRPSTIVPGFPARLEALLLGMLGRAPNTRPSARAVAVALDDIARTEGHAPPTEVLRRLVVPPSS